MRSRFAVLSAAVVSMALVAWMAFVWSRRAEPATEGLEITAASGLDGSEAAIGAAAIPRVEPSSALEAGTAPQRAGLAGEAELDCRLSVVFDADGTPAPGVDVHWFGSAVLADQRWRDDLDELGMGLEFFERNGRRFVSDSEGVVRVPTSKVLAQGVATTPTHFGMVTCPVGIDSKGAFVIRLRSAFGVDVRVRSAASRAAVRDVVVVASCSLLPDSRVGARTDERGIARLFPLFHGDEPRGPWHAELPGVFFEEIRAPLPLEERSEPLELLLPDSAPAVVRIVDKQGNLCPLSGKLLIGWNDRDGDPVEPRRLRITNGLANLTRIEFGLSLHARAQLTAEPESPEGVFTLEGANPPRACFDLLLKSR